MQVNIYTYQTLRGARKSGAGAYVLEVAWGRRIPATATGTMHFEDTTENGAELELLLTVLRRLNRTVDIAIYTESGYLAAGLETYLSRWQEQDFRNAKGQKIAHAELWQEVAEIIGRFNLRPVVLVAAQHSYRNWLIREAENRAKKGE